MNASGTPITHCETSDLLTATPLITVHSTPVTESVTGLSIVSIFWELSNSLLTVWSEYPFKATEVKGSEILTETTPPTEGFLHTAWKVAKAVVKLALWCTVVTPLIALLICHHYENQFNMIKLENEPEPEIPVEEPSSPVPAPTPEPENTTPPAPEGESKPKTPVEGSEDSSDSSPTPASEPESTIPQTPEGGSEPEIPVEDSEDSSDSSPTPESESDSESSGISDGDETGIFDGDDIDSDTEDSRPKVSSPTHTSTSTSPVPDTEKEPANSNLRGPKKLPTTPSNDNNKNSSIEEQKLTSELRDSIEQIIIGIFDE